MKGLLPMKKFCLILSLLLCACTSFNSAGLSVRSDLRLVSDKSIYYDVKDTSVMATRINRIIRKRLKDAGWKIGTNKKTARYSYSIFTDTKTYTVNHVIPTQNGGAVVAPETFSYPFFSVEIMDNKTYENVYEAQIALSSDRTYAELEKFVGISTPSLFLTEDKVWDIECTSEYDGEKEVEQCSLIDPNAPPEPLFELP